MRRVLAALTAATIAILALIIWNEQNAPAPDNGTTENAAIRPLPVLAGQLPAENTGRRTQSVQTILARPLFIPGRRPAPQVADATAPTPDRSLPRMTGILIDGAKRNAIFAAASDGGRSIVVSEGGRIGPFMVQTIEPQQVTVVGPDGKRAIRTSFDPHPPPPVVPAVPTGLLGAPGAPGLIVLPGAQQPVAR